MTSNNYLYILCLLSHLQSTYFNGIIWKIRRTNHFRREPSEIEFFKVTVHRTKWNKKDEESFFLSLSIYRYRTYNPAYLSKTTCILTHLWRARVRLLGIATRIDGRLPAPAPLCLPANSQNQWSRSRTNIMPWQKNKLVLQYGLFQQKYRKA